MAATRTFHIRMSECCYPFLAANLIPHAPRKPGIYKLLSVDDKMGSEVLYVGWAAPGHGETLYAALAGHMMGRLRPSSADLSKATRDVYFEYAAEADVASPEDFKDIAGALIARFKPRLNPSAPPPASGRYGPVEVVLL